MGINKEEILKEAGIAACKILVTGFKLCDLETHIEQMFIDENTGEEFILKFYSKNGFNRLSKDIKFEKRICKTCGKEYMTSDGWTECELCYHHSF